MLASIFLLLSDITRKETDTHKLVTITFLIKENFKKLFSMEPQCFLINMSKVDP